MTSYHVGDIPNEDIVLEPDFDEVDLTSFNSADVALTLDGEEVETSGFIATVGNETVVIEWPEDSVLNDPGVYQVEVTLHGTTARLTLDPVRIVAEARTGWLSLATARSGWAGAPNDDADLYEMLEVAKDQVIEYAPAPLPTKIPINYRRAQGLQARNVWNATIKDTSGDIGGEGYSAPIFPLDWQVKNLIRPRKGVPFVR